MLSPCHTFVAASQPAAVVRLTIPRAEIRRVMGPAMDEIRSAIARQNIGFAGAFFCHHFRIDPQLFDLEVGVPTMDPVASMGRVQPTDLPHAVMARTLYQGGYEGLGAAWGQFSTWIRDQQHAVAPDLWEHYLSGPISDPGLAADQWQTELHRPLTGVTPGPLTLSDLIPHLEAIVAMSSVDLAMRRMGFAWQMFRPEVANPHHAEIADLVASFSKFEPNPQFCNRNAGMYDGYDLQQRVRDILQRIHATKS